MKKYLPLFFALSFLLGSCEEDVDLTAPYKDITVVYGLLNRNDTTHYIRIQKAFLGDENALMYCTIPDSLYYPSSLNAFILGYNSGGTLVTTDSFYLQRVVNDVQKDSGIFAAFNNVLYKGTKVLDPTHTYKLMVIKPNGDTTWAGTEIAANVAMVPPPSLLDWEPTIPGAQEPSVHVSWALDQNAAAYQVGLSFHYQEWKFGSPGNVTDKTITRNFNMFVPTGDYLCNVNQVCFDISKSQFYGTIVANIHPDPPNTLPDDVTLRKFISVDITVSVAADDLYSYIKFNAPSLSYVQKVTAWTNIHNGVGIFSSRTSGGYKGLGLNQQTLDSLQYGQYTSDLNFQP